MKENILKRLKKYNTGGGMMADAQPIVETVGKQGIKTGLGRLFSSPLATRLLGLGSAALSTGAAGYEFMKGYGKELPNMGATIGDLAGQSGLSTMGSMKQMGGVQPLPGGVMEPIPGSDAVVFKGNKHNESGMGSDSGIMVDQQTEVEGGGVAADGTLLEGETMDQVNMKHGGKRDYFFSDHLKKGGVSYANMHKNILEMGGSQEDINMLARMQEKAAGRDPNQVAKLGGVVDYNKGGVKAPKGFHFMKKGEGEYNLMKHGDKPFKPHKDASLVANFPIQKKHYNTGGGRLSIEQIRSMYPEYATDIENLQNYNPNLSAEENRLNENMRKGNYLYDDDDITFVDSYGMNFTPDVMNQMSAGLPTSEMETTLAQAKDFVEEKEEKTAIDPNEYAAEMARLYPEETDKAREQLNKLLNRQVPTEAKVGFAAQFLPAIGAMLTRQKDPEQFEYTPGFTSPIVAGRVKGLKYEAPNQNEARSRLASSYLGQQRFLDTSGAGAAGLSNRQALFARKLQAEGTLGAQESKDRLAAENLSKQSQMKADITNTANELKAASANAQLIQREAARKQAVDAANTQLRNTRENEKVTNRLSILNNLSRGITTGAGDLMSYKATDRLARATGQYGIYERDKIKNALRSMPEYANTPDEELNIIVNNIMNKKG